LKAGADHLQLLDLLYDHAPLSLLVNLLVPVLVSIPLMHEVPLYILSVWCTAALIVALIRFFLLWRRQNQNLNSTRQPNSRSGAYIAFTVMQGLVWGVGGVFLLEITSGFNQVLLLVLIAGTSAGAIPLLGATLPVYTGYLLSSTLPVAAWLFSQGGIQYWTLGAIGCVFVYVCYIGATRFNGILTRSLLSERAGKRGLEFHGSPRGSSDAGARTHPQVESEVRDRAKMEQVITTLSAGFVRLTVGEIDGGIRHALAKIGSYACIDRSYIYLFNDDDNSGRITHQWSKEGVSPRVSPEFHLLVLSRNNIQRGRGVYFPSRDELPVEARAEQEFFDHEKLKSWVAVPLIADGKARGFLGFDAIEKEIRWSEDTIALLRIAGAALMNALERKRDEALIQCQAYQDPLTSLPNRRRFMARMEQTFKECRRQDAKAAILFMDVDYFKNINDSLGHAAGDTLLKQIAERLQSGLKGGDMACRLGGDEFIILLTELEAPSMDPEQSAFAIARRVHRELSLPYEISGREVNITLSMGVELFPSKCTTSEAVISNADSAMYQAKHCGRNFIQFFEPDMYSSAKSRLQLDEDLRNALRLNKFEFYAQSQVNSSRDVIADELLLRWKSDNQGIVESKEFITHAEDLGLITDIDEWVINNACELIRHQKHLDHDKNVTYAINVSAPQFLRKDFTHLVSEALDKSGVSGGFLEFEINESIFSGNREEVLEKMNSLRAMDVRIVLDDFGLGHSSLATLRYLPINKIKIDKSFVRGVEKNRDDEAIVDAIIAVGDRFKLEVVAEGVESDTQFELLQSRGIGLFQGHYFGHPRPLMLN